MSTTVCQAGVGGIWGRAWPGGCLGQGCAAGMREQQRAPEAQRVSQTMPLACSKLPISMESILRFLPPPTRSRCPAEPSVWTPPPLTFQKAVLSCHFLISAQMPLPQGGLPNHKTAPTPPPLVSSVLTGDIGAVLPLPPAGPGVPYRPFPLSNASGREGLQS